MNLASYLMESRGLVNTAQRLPTIAMRFGMTASRMEKALLSYTRLAQRYSATPTLFVTGNLLTRYPRTFQRVADAGAVFGLHGYVHTDYAQLPLARQRDDFARTIASFDRLGIPARGFRGPYLRWNEDSIAAARDLGLVYGSNRGVAWDVLRPTLNGNGEHVEAYEKGLKLYGAVESENVLSLPAYIEGVLDMPASLPDDEAIVDRLRLSPPLRQAVWRALVSTVHDNGELLVHTLHHERLGLCRTALTAMLEEARSVTPHAWMASLDQVRAWWETRAQAQFRTDPLKKNRYRVVAEGGEGLTVLVKNVSVPGARDWCGGWSVVEPGTEFEVDRAPWIGIPDQSPAELESFLAGEGFVVRRGPPCDEGTYLDDVAPFTPARARDVLRRIEASPGPIARLWRWPSGARCAVSLTSDVDSMSLLDFARRPLEV
jgi:hypothetical protein